MASCTRQQHAVYELSAECMNSYCTSNQQMKHQNNARCVPCAKYVKLLINSLPTHPEQHVMQASAVTARSSPTESYSPLDLSKSHRSVPTLTPAAGLTQTDPSKTKTKTHKHTHKGGGEAIHGGHKHSASHSDKGQSPQCCSSSDAGIKEPCTGDQMQGYW